MTRYRCGACRVEYSPRRYCPRCGGALFDVGLSADGVDFGQPGNVPRLRRRKRNSNAAALVRAAKSPRMVPWGDDKVWAPLFGTATVKGPAGSGKSTWATATAMRIGHETGVRVLYVSAEEGGEASALVRLARVAEMMGIDVPESLILSDAQDVHEADEDIAAYEDALGDRVGFIVLDSLSQLRAPQPWWEDLLNSGHGVLLVLHTVTTGEARGGREPEFAVSMTIKVDADGMATIEKNRWGATGPETTFCARQPPRIGGGGESAREGGGSNGSSATNGSGEAEVIPFPRKKP